MSTRQAGFGIIEIIIIVVAAGLIGLAGWQVYSASTHTDASSGVLTAEPPAQSDLSRLGGDYPLMEWGLKLPLADSLDRAAISYGYEETADGSTVTITNNNDPYVKYCKTTSVTVAKLAEKHDHNSHEHSQQDIAEAVEIDGYQYYVSTPYETACAELDQLIRQSDPAVSEALNTQTRALLDAARSLKR